MTAKTVVMLCKTIAVVYYGSWIGLFLSVIFVVCRGFYDSFIGKFIISDPLMLSFPLVWLFCLLALVFYIIGRIVLKPLCDKYHV